MPEEINRILTDHVADMLFITEESGITNLKNEGIPENKIYFVGNTMIDTLMAFKEKASKSIILDKLGLIRKGHDKEVNCNGINPYAANFINPQGQ
jgi:UDP-N-acetylglucosamine 2-epimerase (non-hydrolysing)